VSAIKRITMDSPLYAQEAALREQELLRPIGFDMARFRREFAGLEERLEHFVAVADQHGRDRVIACAALLPNEPREGCGRITQMAVDRQRQGEGLGRRLVVAVESRAFGELGLRELYCNVQVSRAGFFEALGWEPEGEVFTEAGVPHRKMVMRYQPQEPVQIVEDLGDE
jgi:N-acetylglutamate synthase-like GNAT family acetyltransferase